MKGLRIVLSVLFATCQLISVRAEIFTSIQDLTEVFAFESRVVDALAQYLTKTEARLDRIRRYLRDYEQVKAEVRVPYNLDANSEEQIIEKLAGNPIHAFHLVKRLTVDWKYIGEHSPSEDWEGVEKALLESGMDVNALQLPDEEDLHGTAQALVRLQSVYQLNTSSLVRGNVMGVQSYAELSAQDCLYMGKHSFNMGKYYNAIEWFEEAYNQAGLERNSSISQEQVADFLNTAIEAFAESQETPSIAEEGKTMSTKRSNSDLILRSKKFLKEVKRRRLGHDLSMAEDFDNFEALCRGENLMSEAYKATLKCFYDRRNSSYLTLMPAKVEVHHLDPEIVVFHDVISDAEIQHFRTLAKPQLSRALVQGLRGKGHAVSTTRTSKVAWMDAHHEDETLQAMTRRIAHLTGLLTDLQSGSAEQFQIANYGTGGHYSPHHDYLLADKTAFELHNNLHPRELELGDRIATFMFYISNVKRGGATAFPKLGVSLWPQKGSAAFWMNLKKSGTGNNMTLHGACPVVHGSKWVSNKWIREKNQFGTRPCGLTQDE